MSKRVFDLVCTILGLAFLSPFLLVLMLIIKLTSTGPVFFKQERVGRFGRTFQVYKFRTMVVDAELKGLKITVGHDPRITWVGHFLRKYKLDELPQLLNVVRGEMSLVGPRPEVRRYMDCYDSKVRDLILSVRPGITDRASIEFRDENKILAQAEDPERAYIEEVLPIKQRYCLKYVSSHSLLSDVAIIFDTLRLAVFRVH